MDTRTALERWRDDLGVAEVVSLGIETVGVVSVRAIWEG